MTLPHRCSDWESIRASMARIFDAFEEAEERTRHSNAQIDINAEDLSLSPKYNGEIGLINSVLK